MQILHAVCTQMLALAGCHEALGDCRVVITDHGAFVLLNVYAPNAGGTSEGRPRADFKLKFLHALKDKVDGLAAAGKQACHLFCPMHGCSALSCLPLWIRLQQNWFNLCLIVAVILA